jgi:sulfur carrier protein
MVRINGIDVDTAGKTVDAYINETDIDTSRIAVEINGEILPKANYGKYIFADGDCCEIVSFVGGG